MAEPSTSSLTSAHFYAWKKGLKTGMYYLRTRPKAAAIQFTVDQTALASTRAKNKQLREDEELKQPTAGGAGASATGVGAGAGSPRPAVAVATPAAASQPQEPLPMSPLDTMPIGGMAPIRVVRTGPIQEEDVCISCGS